MEFGLGPSLGLLSVILFLLPGLAGIKLGLQIAGRGDWFSRLDTTALSFALSLGSMLLLYIAASVYRSYKNERAREWLSQAEVASWLSTLPNIITIYFALVVVCLVAGATLGKYDFGGSYLGSNLTWGRFHELAKLNGKGETYAVRVRTSAGDEIRGKVEEEGEAALNRDIILENPRRLRFDENNEVVSDSKWTGYAYIHSQNIAHVEFDRLEDADSTEAEEREREEQKTLQDTSTDEGEDEEIAELEEFAKEAGEE